MRRSWPRPRRCCASLPLRAAERRRQCRQPARTDTILLVETSGGTYMARVRLNETQDLPEDHRWLFERMEKRGGILNINRI